ncbi:MAG TPA: isoprenylcysteine carboxylmethyltransferase family protein [Candidatus Lustribacter sp.]|jgi:protein-S-isoprenylcysteine O-methyltransferase Ste14|nr:isoprenylcysteine carboxylmethyltransferase family protein [Candidatus Lustribacter sp.]
MAVAIFLPAWTLNYWQAWLFIVVFAASGSAITVYLLKHDPQLMERRLHGGPGAETSVVQRCAMSAVSLGFVALLIVPALDHRFGWSNVSTAAVIGGEVLILIGFTIVCDVMRVNPFASATIETPADQRVISTGPYGIVRHPMYAGAGLYLIGIPPALGSWWGLCVLAFMLPALIWRLLDEEAQLTERLPGYAAYRERVRYRLLPFVW